MAQHPLAGSERLSLPGAQSVGPADPAERLDVTVILRQAAEDSGLVWHRQLFFTKLHRFFKMGGIIVELRRP